MKRQFVLLALLALVLSGCSSAGAAPVMYIQPAELSAEEEAVAKLLGADTDQHLFDVVLDGTAKKVSVNTYELVDGAWEQYTGGGGISLDEEDTRGRMAFGFEDLRGEYREAIQFGRDRTTVKYCASEEHDDTLGRGIAFLSDRTEIVYEEEIPLAVQINTSGNKIVSYDVEYFFQPEEYQELGYEHVYALTVMFSQEPLP
ncbi:hypothetical protein [uncultured Oscillibacter sp.]|uniref:hypothetical protein n=1 Tax=uncultured Oscillibacter sp. TaxID=876091 RepID=UPI0025CDEF8F|nr:hypothetical protein [uncultured Oscillibacter sp.]